MSSDHFYLKSLPNPIPLMAIIMIEKRDKKFYVTTNHIDHCFENVQVKKSSKKAIKTFLDSGIFCKLYGSPKRWINLTKMLMDMKMAEELLVQCGKINGVLVKKVKTIQIINRGR